MNRSSCPTLVGAIGLLAMTGCASTGEQQPDNNDAGLAAVLGPIAETEYVTADKCLRQFDYQHVEILNERLIVFHGRGGRMWVNELPHRCIGMRKNDTLVFERTTSQLCALDSVTPVDEPFGAFSSAGPACALGEFQPITDIQLQTLRDSFP